MLTLTDANSITMTVDSGSDVEAVVSAVNDSGTALTYVVNTVSSNGATPVSLLSSPSAGHHRVVRSIIIRNNDSTERTCTVFYDSIEIKSIQLLPGGTLEYTPQEGWRVFEPAGEERRYDISISASFSSFSSSFALDSMNWYAASGSFVDFSASFVGFSASWSAGTTDLTDLNLFSASMLAASSSFESRLLSQTASIVVLFEASSSFAAGGGGGGGSPTITVIEGFDTSNSYRSAADQLPGSTSFTAIWYGFLYEFIHGSPQFLMGNHNMSGHGWAINLGTRTAGSAAYIQFEIRDGSGPVGPSLEVLEAHDFDAYCMRPLHLAIRYTGGSARGFMNGQATRFEGTGTGYTAASGARFTVGNNPSVWNEPSTRAGFAGAGYFAGALTNAQIQNHFQACREAGNRFVEGGISWDHRYDIVAPGGSFPTQIDDLAGSAHLERVGTAITATTTKAV